MTDNSGGTAVLTGATSGTLNNLNADATTTFLPPGNGTSNVAGTSVTFNFTTPLTTSGGGSTVDLSLPVAGLNAGGGNATFTFTPVPEPATVLGLATAGLGLAGFVRRRFC